MPTRRSLETWEIIDQFLQARDLVRSQGRRVTGAVFMGMGEPFLNYDRVLAAADLLRCPFGASVGARSITISTVGLVPEIDRYTRESRPFRLAISLGAATDSKRAPGSCRLPAALRSREVMAAARRHALARRERVMLVYVCIAGVNVDDSDAQALADLIGDTPVRLDLIEVTDPTGEFLRPTLEEFQPIPRRARPQAPAARRPAIFRRRRHQGRLRHPGRRLRSIQNVSPSECGSALAWNSSRRKRRQQLERLFQVRSQRRLAFDPRLGVRQRLEDATPFPDAALDHAPVDQEQQDDRSLMQRHRRPVLGMRQVVLEVQPGVSDRFLEQRERNARRCGAARNERACRSSAEPDA